MVTLLGMVIMVWAFQAIDTNEGLEDPDSTGETKETTNSPSVSFSVVSKILNGAKRQAPDSLLQIDLIREVIRLFIYEMKDKRFISR